MGHQLAKPPEYSCTNSKAPQGDRVMFRLPSIGKSMHTFTSCLKVSGLRAVVHINRRHIRRLRGWWTKDQRTRHMHMHMNAWVTQGEPTSRRRLPGLFHLHLLLHAPQELPPCSFSPSPSNPRIGGASERESVAVTVAC